MVSDKDDTIERGIDTVHHSKLAGPGPDNLYVVGKLFNKQILSVSVRITHQKFGGSSFACGLNNYVDFVCHDLPEPAIFKTLRPELLTGNDAGQALHIC